MASGQDCDSNITNSSASIRGRRLSRLVLLGKGEDHRNPISERNPLLVSPPRPSVQAKKKSFASVAFRGLGCTSSSSAQVYTPATAAVRSSADWQGRRSRCRKKKSKVKRKEREREREQQTLPHRRNQMAATAAADIWCTPGYALAAVADASVDCVVSHGQQQQRPLMGRGRAADTERIQRERACMEKRQSDNEEQLSSFIDSPESTLEMPLFRTDRIIPSGHSRHSRGFRRSPGGLEEIMMFQTRLLLGGMDVYDRYRDWRLDVDNMSYEELLELGDKIGYVNTGLREEEILRCLRRMKHSIFDVQPLHFTSEIECKCSICQEEYEVNDEVGKLECSHSYHLYCIKQWLLQKKVCPVCKTAVAKI